MKVTIRKVDPAHYAVTTDVYLTNGEYLSDHWTELCLAVEHFDRDANAWIKVPALRSAKGDFIRVGGMFRLPLKPDTLAAVQAMQVGDEITR